MKQLELLNTVIGDIVQLRAKQGRVIVADLFQSPLRGGIMLRLYHKQTETVRRIDITEKELLSGNIYATLERVFGEFPFNEPSPLEKLL